MFNCTMDSFSFVALAPLFHEIPRIFKRWQNEIEKFRVFSFSVSLASEKVTKINYLVARHFSRCFPLSAFFASAELLQRLLLRFLLIVE